MNPQNNNQNGPTKNKFINEALFDEAGAQASSSGQVISWGVGGNNKNNVQNDINLLDSTQLINMVSNDYVDPQTGLFEQSGVNNSINGYSDVNGIQNQPLTVEQIVDNSRLAAGVNQDTLSSEYAQTNGPFYGYNANPELLQNSSTQIGVNYTQNISELNTPTMMQQPVMTGQNDLVSNGVVVDDNIASNQPLAMMALSGEVIDEAQKPKDVDENAKYFQNTPLVDNRLYAQEVGPMVATSVTDPLAEPQRQLNSNELVRSFVGVNYQNIAMSSFNFWSGFFGPMYFFYRKMYLYGFIVAIINVLLMLLMLVNPFVYLGASSVEFILICLLTNSLYLGFANNQVVKIVATNPNANQYELQKICQSKGGTNLLVAILISVGISFISGYIMSILGVTAILTEMVNNFGTKPLPRDDTPIEEVIEYSIPDGFSEYDKDENFLVYYETDMVDDKEFKREACMVSIGLVAKHKTSKDLVTYMADSDKRYNRVSTYKAANGDVWDMYDFVHNGSHQTYRARKIDGHIVLVTFASIKGSTDGVCDAYLEQIMNSIKEK